MNSNNIVRMAMALVFGRDTRKKQLEYSCFTKTLKAADVPKLDMSSMFQDYESSPLYDIYLPEGVKYVRATWDLNASFKAAVEVDKKLPEDKQRKYTSVDRALYAMEYGLNNKTLGLDIPDFEERFGQWNNWIDGNVRDHITCFFTKEQVSEKDMGVKTVAETQEDMGRRMKYKQSISAPCAYMLQPDGQTRLPIAWAGKVVDLKAYDVDYGHIVDFTVQYRQTYAWQKPWTARYRSIEISKDHPWFAVYDGVNFESAVHLQHFARMGDAPLGKITQKRAMGPLALGKPFFKGLDQHADIRAFEKVFINGKKQIGFTGDDFYHFLMTDVHGNDEPNYDMQMVYNMYSTGKGLEFFAKDAERYFAEQVELLQNHELWHKNFMRMASNSEDPDLWLPLAFAKRGLYNIYPAGFRSQAGMVLEPLSKSYKGRIPMTDATRRYIGPCPDTIRQDGHLDPTASCLKGNRVAVYGFKTGPGVLVPQPSGNPSAHYITEVIESPWKCGDGIYMSPEMMAEHHTKNEGRDNDDAEILRVGPEYVAHFKTLDGLFQPSLVDPLAKQIVEPASARTRNVKYLSDKYIRRETPKTEWSKRALANQVRILADQITVGIITNPVLADTLISLQKESMLRRIEDIVDSMKDDDSETGKALRERWVSAYFALEMLPAWRLGHISQNIETWIDNIKMKGSVDNAVRQELMQFFKDTPVFPSSLKISKNELRGRVPESIMKDDPLFVDTDLCAIIGHARSGSQPATGFYFEVEGTREVSVEIEALLVKPLAPELRSMFPANGETRQEVSEMRRWTYDWWEDYRQKFWGDNTPDGEMLKVACQKYNDAQYDLLDMSQVFADSPEAFWVEWASRIYTGRLMEAPVDEAGFGKHINDWSIWTTGMRWAAFRAHEKAGLAGETALLQPKLGVKLPAEAKVKVENSAVSLKRNGRYIGTADCPDGVYDMVGRYIVVRPCSPSMKPGWKL